MIQTFSCSDTESFFKTGTSRRLNTEIRSSGKRALEALNRATSLNDLRGVGRSLENQGGNKWAFRVNDKYRVVFRWNDGHAYEVEITNYHR
jgi:proteic killer suppression protein